MQDLHRNPREKPIYMPIHMTRDEFEALVSKALDSLPEKFRTYLANVVVEVHDHPQAFVVGELKLKNPRTLLGFYRGVPITRRSVEQAVGFPEYVYIYQANLERLCATPEELVEQVQKTVLHEIGHHMGLDEGDLDDLGYG